MAYDIPKSVFVVHIDGWDGIILALNEMPLKIRRRLSRTALREAAAPCLARAKELVPVSEEGSHGHLPGHLWRHLQMFTGRAPKNPESGSTRGVFSVGVGILAPQSDKEAPYWGAMVEWGHHVGARKKFRGKWSVSAPRRKIGGRWQQPRMNLNEHELLQRGGATRGVRKVMEIDAGRGWVDGARFIRDAFDENVAEAEAILSAAYFHEIDKEWAKEEKRALKTTARIGGVTI